MSKRCPHNNLYVTEIGEEYIYSTVENGVATILDHESDATGRYFIGCQDCGHEKEYNIYNKNVPQWVRKAVDTINEGGFYT